MTQTRVFPLYELWQGETRTCRIGRAELLFVRLDDEVRAYRNRCPHQGFPLTEAKLEDGVLTCPFHGHCFDAGTGAGVNPRSTGLKRVPCRMVDGEVCVDVDDA